MPSNLRYARGDRAYGECALSGRRMLLKDMIENPRTGTLVDPDWAEPPDPAPPLDIFDAVALDRPAPDLSQIETAVYIGTIPDAYGDVLRPLCMFFNNGCGTVVVT